MGCWLQIGCKNSQAFYSPQPAIGLSPGLRMTHPTGCILQSGVRCDHPLGQFMIFAHASRTRDIALQNLNGV